MRSLEFVASGERRRLLVLLGFSLGLHLFALLWVKAPAGPPAALAALSATLRITVESALQDMAPTVSSGLVPPPSAKQEARQPPVRREPKALPAVREVAGPATSTLSMEPDSPAMLSTQQAPALPSPPAAAPAGESPRALERESRLLDAYASRLAAIFSRLQQYPRLAAQRGWEGEVRVRLSVGRQGVLNGRWLERSSGFEVLDRHALEMVDRIGSLPALPAEFEAHEIQVVVPVLYKLRKAE